MNLKRILFSLALVCFTIAGCKENIPVKKEAVSLAISGMTCEIGCAKTIASKLSKKEGVFDAQVIFKDSIATIEYDANKTSKKELIAFVEGIAGGNLYKATESSSINTTTSHECTASCEEKCATKNTKKECKEDCKMACCADKKAS